MQTVFIILIIVFVWGWLAYRQIISGKKKRLEELKSQWGKPRTGHFPFHLIGAYNKANKKTGFHRLSAQTLADIDFEAAFTVIDRTVSRPGQQYLFHRLQAPVADRNELEELDKKIEFFRQETSIRFRIQERLLLLSDTDAYSISNLLSEKLLQRPSWFNWMYADLAIVITLLLLSFLYPVCLILLIIPLAVNIFLHFWNSNNTFGFIRSLPQLNRLLKLVELLCKEDIPFRKDRALNAVAALKGFRRRLNYVTLADGGMKDEMMQAILYLFQIIKALFLIEIISFFRLIKELENKQDDIYALFEFVGEIDMAISIASLRSGDAKVCKPVFSVREKGLSSEEIYHPLISNCTPNSITVNGKSVLITGSNMSGKTSFLRTVALNALFAQTICTCFARSFHLPFVKLYSSIRIDDDLLEGKSYYFEEVEIMGGLIGESQSGEQCLFVLDEVFKGTNTVERIAAAKAILSYLNKNDNLVFVATHDIELAEMLSAEYDLYHFSETIKDDQLDFDHRLKHGPLTTRNAIRILEISNYPEEIIRNARAISQT